MKRIIFLSVVLFLLVPSVAFANFVWPAMYMTSYVYSWKIILASILLEMIAIRWMTKFPILKSMVVSVVINAVSAVIGAFLLPFSGIVWELIYGPIREWIFDYGTFHWSTWITTLFIAACMNVVLEGLAMRIIFKFRSSIVHILLLFLVNTITILFAAFAMQKEHPFF
ncbi:hypothetical protein [Cohnella hashimotonis]|uniref:Uncharacterized protein n=1 Tax=Cohnella hashimotonis TaxID=2826895 RepID=A0ABT6TNR2_9BACL|nr:hypothetical protein [Cohnella hashimotonis]MDI4647888.1 hypothetical protein [Cohnella hashimotonis]